MNSGAESSEATLAELLTALADGDLSFTGFRKLILQRMAETDDTALLTKLATVLSAEATGENTRAAEQRHSCPLCRCLRCACCLFLCL